MEKKEIIAELLKNGGKPVAGMVTKDNGVTYEEGETNVIFVSLYSITSLLKDDDNAAFAANHLVEHPDSMSIVLSRATLNIIQETVEAGTEYKNPWSNNAEATVFEHKTIITHVTDVTLSDFAIRKLDKLADSLLGI